MPKGGSQHNGGCSAYNGNGPGYRQLIITGEHLNRHWWDEI